MWDLIDEKLGEKTGAKKGDTIKKYSGELIALKRTSTPEVSSFEVIRGGGLFANVLDRMLRGW